MKTYIRSVIILGLVFLNLMTMAQKEPSKTNPRLNRIANSLGNQDCVTAKPICTSAAFSDNSSGIGDVQELNSINGSCFISPGIPLTEHQSSWYYFDIKVGGTLTFTIYPNNNTNDYDFAVWGPHATCPVDYAPIRCNSYGVGELDSTGLSSTATNNSEGPGTGNPFSRQLTTIAGERYILLIDNYSNLNSGFRITFGGTATLDCSIVQAKIEATQDSICPKQATTLTVKSAQTFTWSNLADSTNSISTNKQITINPSVTTTYVVKGTNDAALPYRVTKVVYVYPPPNVKIAASPNAICKGGFATLNGSGANSYQWSLLQTPSNTISSNVSISVNPTITTTYLLVGTDTKGCVNKDSLPITVYPNPVITITGNAAMCLHDSVVLRASGASTYTWSTTQSGTVIANTAQVTFRPNASTKYISVGTDNNGCVGRDTFAVTVNPLPIINLTTTPSPAIICLHDNLILKAKGGKTYKWYIQGSGSVIGTDTVLTVSPPKDTSYTVVVTDIHGCTSSASTTITVHPLPVVGAFTSTDSVCIGNSAQLTGTGAQQYNWKKQGDPTTLASTPKYTVSPTVATTYVVTGTDNNNCSSTATKSIYVNPLPNIQIVSSDDSICPGTRTRLDPKNGISYLWYNALAPTTPISNDNPYFVSPTITTTYNITGTDIHNCSNTNHKEIYVFARPQTQPIKGSRYVCPTSTGARYNIRGGGSSTSTYHWTVTGNATIQTATQGNDTIKVDFGQPGKIYMTVQETNKYGCLGDVIADTIVILDNYVPPAAAGSISVCTIDKNNVSYTAPLGNTDSYYLWHIVGGQNLVNDSLATVQVKWNGVSPPICKIYYTEVSKTAVPACHFNSDTLNVNIYQTPTANRILGDSSVCKGDKGLLYDLQGMGGSTYQWQIKGGHIVGGIVQNNITVNMDKDTSTVQLKVIETSNHGCPGAPVIQKVIINQPPQAGPITGASIICPSNALGEGYSTTGNITSRFKWTIQGGVITGQGSGGKIVTANWNFSSSNPYISVTEISKDSCVGPTVTLGITEDETTAQLLVVTTNEQNDKSIDINWLASNRSGSTVNTYNLYKRQYGVLAAWQPLGISNMVETNYSDAGATLNTHKTIYEYQYSTKDLCGGVSTSKANNSILLGGTGNESSKKVQLKWNNYHNWSRGLLKYEVWRKLDDEPEYTYYSTTSTDTEATYTNGLDGFKHRYRIKSIEAITGKYAWSNDTTITFQHKVEIPNAYSPNGDGVNDRWEIKDIEAYPNTELEIFDRWGAKVYSSPSYKNDWDGRATGGKELPDGTYYYILKLGGKGAFGIDTMNGNITIVR